MPSVRVTGADKFRRVAAVLAEHEDGKALKRKLSKAIRDGAREIPVEQRAAVGVAMPHSGGLGAALEAAGYTIRTSYVGNAGVTITDSWRGHDMKAVDEGSIRHPLFGNRGHWYSQRVPPRVLTKVFLRHRRPVQVAIIAALDALAEEIAKEA